MSLRIAWIPHLALQVRAKAAGSPPPRFGESGGLPHALMRRQPTLRQTYDMLTIAL